MTATQQPPQNPYSAFAIATTAATAGVAGIVALGSLAGVGTGPTSALLAVSIGVWAVALLIDRPRALLPAGLAALAAAIVQVVFVAHGDSTALSGVLATVALAASIGTIGRMLPGEHPARAACGLIAFAAMLYVTAMNLIIADARLDGFAAGIGALLPIGVWMLLGHRIEWNRRPPLAQVVAWCGIGVVVGAVAGALAGAPFLVGLVAGGVPLPAESAVCIVCILGAFIAAERGRRRFASALLAPPVFITLLTIATREQVLAVAVDPWPAVYSVGWWLQYRLQAISATVLFGAAATVWAGVVLGRHRLASTIRWTGGVLLGLAAMLSLLASGTADDASIEAIGAHRGAVPGVLGSLALGIALLLHQPARSSQNKLRTIWLPLFAALAIAAMAVQFYRLSEATAAIAQQRESAVAATGVEAAIRGSLADRIVAVERFGERLLSVSPGERGDLFAIEAAQAVQARDAIQSIAWVDADRKVLRIVAANGSTRLLGRNAAFEPARVAAYQRAEIEARPVAIGPVTLAGAGDSAVLVILPGPFSAGRTEFLVAALRIDELLTTSLRNLVVDQQIAVDTSTGRVYERDLSPTARSDDFPTARSFAVLGSDWTLRMAPLPSSHADKDSVLRQTLLWFGLAIAALVSMALRLAAIARERALAAEAASKALRAEIDAREQSEQALVRSENMANRLLEGMSDAVLTLDHDLTVRYVNAAGRRVVRSLSEDPIGLPIDEIFPQFNGSEFAKQFRHVIEQQQPSSIEAYSVGLRRWLSGRMYPVDGGLTGFFADITDMRRAMQFESDQRAVLVAIATGKPLAECVAMAILLYESRFENTVGAVLRFDAAAARFHGAIAPNLPAAMVLAWEGVTAGAEIASCGVAVQRGERVVVADIAADHGWERCRPALLAIGLRACWSQPIDAADDVVLGTFAIYCAQARAPTAEESAGLDSVAALVGIALERDRAAIRVETERQRFRSLSERSPYMVYAFDLARRLVDCNANVVREGGFPREALIGMDAQALVLKPFRETVRRSFDAAMRGESSRFDCAVLTAGRQRREVEVTLVPIEVDQRIVGVFGVVRDTTEERRTAAELDRALLDVNQRNRELQDFAFVASHDLQEPLRKVQAFSDRVVKRFADQLDPQGVDYLQRIDSAAHRMQILIDDLLAYSRITSQGQPFVLVDLDRVLREVLSDLEIRIDESAAEVVVGALPQVMGDRTQMRQLLQNLLANALKFRAADRAPRISIAASAAEDAPGWVKLVVQDNGIGFDAIYSERIFGPFQRLHGRHEYDGTGIGLAVVRKIVERHGGQIVAIGQPGIGARFEITLPAHTAGRLAPA